ncbi:MAG: hypothetical protein HY096_09850 [Nitrospinae bacterium]|nr:hypothetical protein [Nitrospinota bacterium]
MREKYGEKADRIWRAWRYSPIWTVNEIAQVTGIKRLYVKLIMCIYKKEGFIKQIGKRGRSPLYCLIDRELRERPRILK